VSILAVGLLLEEAFALSVAGAANESGDEEIMYPGGRGQEVVFKWVDDTGNSNKLGTRQ